jgi:formylmethanofuran dehydrogenase subunit E
MNKETYEALKRIMDILRYYREEADLEGEVFSISNNVDIKQVEDWLDEVAKDYTEKVCEGCGEALLEGQSIAGSRHGTCI